MIVRVSTPRPLALLLTLLLSTFVGSRVLPASDSRDPEPASWDDTYAAVFEANPGRPRSCSGDICTGDAVADSKHQLSRMRTAENYQRVRGRLARYAVDHAAFRVEAYGSYGMPYRVVWAVERAEGVGQVFWLTDRGILRSRRIPAATWLAVRSEVKAAMGSPLRSALRYSGSSHPRSAFVSVRIGERSDQFILNPRPPGVSRSQFERFWQGYEREVAVVEAILSLSPDRQFHW